MPREKFPRIELIRRALQRLIPAWKRGDLPPPDGTPFQPPNETDTPVEIWAQEAARCAATRYGLSGLTVVVSFSGALSGAASVELSEDTTLFVEIATGQRQDYNNIVAALGHEIAHIAIQRHSITAPADLLEEEVMTDVLSIASGFGIYAANTLRVDVEQRSITEDGVTRTYRITRPRWLGYLTPEEVGYTTGRLRIPMPRRSLEREHVRPAIAHGRRRAKREMSAPPLATSAFLRRWRYRRRQKDQEEAGPATLARDQDYSFSLNQVILRCPLCTQKLRAPTAARMTIRCSNCDHGFDCIT